MNFIEYSQNFEVGTPFLHLFIFTAFVVWISLVVYSYKKNGFLKTIRYFFPMVFITIFLETIAISQGSFYYQNYFVYVSFMNGSVPIIILLGWSSSLFLYMNIGKNIVNRYYQKQNILQNILISITAGLLAVSVDLIQDPVAHHNNWWIWTKSTAFLKFYDVPLSNFTGWFIIISGMTLITLIIDKSQHSEIRKVLISFSIILTVFIPIVIYFFL